MSRALGYVFGGFWAGLCEFLAGSNLSWCRCEKCQSKMYKVRYDLGYGPQLDSCYYSWTKARRRLTEMRGAWTSEDAQLWLDLPDGGRQVV